jgi:hypothetical protein
VSPSQQARFLAEALFLADQAGAALFDWSGLQDRTTYLRGFPSVESGLFFNSENDVARDEPKPAFEAFRFPFLVDASGDRASAWGMAPRKRGAVVIERKSKRGWREVRAVQRPRSRVFRIGVPASHGVYRARQGQAISLPWRF